MKRLIPICLVVIAGIVFGSQQFCFAQIEIVDGNGQQVTPSEIPAQEVEPLPTDVTPQGMPQIFNGNGSRIIIRKSFSSVDENGELKTERSGKAIVVGPDGIRREFDLNDDRDLDIDALESEVLWPEPATNEDAQPAAAIFSIGVQCQPLPPAVASQLNLDSGLLVAQVPIGSPAATAKVQKHDVLLFADDKQLTSVAVLKKAVQAAGEADTSISLTLIRGGKEISVVVKPDKSQAPVANPLKFPGFNPGLGFFPNDMRVELPQFGPSELFENDIEARMLQQMEQMQQQMQQRR